MPKFNPPRSTRTLLLTLLSLGLSMGLAAPITMEVLPDHTTVVVSSTERIQYLVDPQAHTVILKDTQLVGEVQLPEGMQVKSSEKDTVLLVPNTYQYALSVNTQYLFLTLKTDPIKQVDDRAPLFVPLENANPSQVAALLQGMYNNIKIQVDDRNRALWIVVNPQDRELITKIIKQMDQPRPQVLFEAEILTVNQSLSEKLGIKYQRMFDFQLKEGEPPSLFQFGKFVRTAINPLGGFNFSVSFLKDNLAAKVLAQPRVATIDGQEARINSTQNIPILLGDKNGTTTLANQTTGITMRFLPKVSPSGMIEANVNINVSLPSGQTEQGIITYSSREASTTIRVQNGEPIVIAGLLENKTTTEVNKIPILSDIPLIGGLFQHRFTSETTSDLIIIVTPRIIQPPVKEP
ncbi:type II secretion system protein GspD [Deinococcus cellulosilyticus]|uniref:Uncharacterized protein n=1 Tax=Deinococcus cellulosilyticus (strain DSM 18568 / NBRC 106333 / KACC 11606 / 5516J-15) TaxID=1223518 RepID=A0A511NCJ7_DEIC1|nr:secretin N-terminal domain-containing protein [Deinococcus cellulosilyticus]GEM50061.1 hypothetical protein DC3_56960 [Deinococcus cellulosilyticus NBRC 106333 = KACC 11606]